MLRDLVAGVRDPLTGLACARILLGVVVLGTGELWSLGALVPAEDVRVFAPWPFGPLVDVLPRGPLALVVYRALTFVAAAAVVVGARTRIASAALAVLLTVDVLLLQLTGAPLHLHHLIWFTTLLALAPAGARLSLDARRAAPLGDAEALEHGARVFALGCASVLGAVYFFPGLHKAFDHGSPFADVDALRRLVHLKAYEAGQPVPWIAAHRTWLALGGLLVIVLELAVWPLAILHRMRAAAFLIVCALHAAFAFFVFIPFTALLACAPLLVVGALPDRAAFRRAPRTALIASALLVAWVSFEGARGNMRGYPFASYPTFSTRVPHSIETATIGIGEGENERLVELAELAAPEMRTTLHARARRVRNATDARRLLFAPHIARALCEQAVTARSLTVWRATLHLDGGSLLEAHTLLVRVPREELCGRPQ